jgi:transcriptional regulator with XRE-family HTH domain
MEMMMPRNPDNVIPEDELQINRCMTRLRHTLKAARKAQGLTLLQVAVEMGLEDAGDVGKYEKGTVIPNTKTFVRWAHAVNCGLYIRGTEKVRDAMSQVRLLSYQASKRNAKV